MIDINLSGILDSGFKLIDSLYDSPVEKAEAKRKLIQLQQEGKLKEFEAQQSVMLAEAKSKDKYTSRARPSILYVFYILVLFSIPMGILSAFNPDMAINIIDGFKNWLNAIPERLYDMFGYVILGYMGTRSFDKHKLLNKGK